MLRLALVYQRRRDATLQQRIAPAASTDKLVNYFATQQRLIEKNKIMSTNTVRLHRVLRATPEKIYRAFLDADAMAKWLPPNGFTGKVHHMDAKVGGTYKMSFTNFTTGQSHSFGGEYLELVAARTHSLFG